MPNPDVPFYNSYYNQIAPSSTVPLFEGAHVEGSVALALWDLYDANDDGDYCVGPDIWGHNNDFNTGENWCGLSAIMDVFYNFDPQPNNPDHNYCWNIYEFIHGWRKLGYPVNTTFVNIFEAHNIPVFLPGDEDGNGAVNLSDILNLISWMYVSGSTIVIEHMSAVDVNADCQVDLSDILWLITYLYENGDDPLVGCYNMYP